VSADEFAAADDSSAVKKVTDARAEAISIRWLDDATVVLRQTKASHWEAPFLFLLFGTHRALLLDTGATEDPAEFPLRAVVDDLIETWLGRDVQNEPALNGPDERDPRRTDAYGLVVAHTHAHGDHIAGDSQFAERPRTVTVGTSVDAVVDFFGFSDWPNQLAQLDLGGRVIDLIPGPGHEPSAVVFFDAATRTLFTGDTIIPGRLYVRDAPTYRTTIGRLMSFAESHDVDQLLGCHIEMSSTPGVDFPVATVDQHDEAPLELPVSIIAEVRDAALEAGDRPMKIVRDRFILYNLVNATA
jgi:hydroxyacylglutathione hydrolase